MPKPETSNHDLGKTILPSINLAMAQKIMDKVRPKTKSKPFDVSTGKFVKGKLKIGNKTTTKNNDKNESLSNIFERISLIIHYTNKKIQLILANYNTILISLFFT